MTRQGMLHAGDTLRQQRLARVQAQIQAENDHNVEAAIAEFLHPCYELVPFDSVAIGAVAVRHLLQQWMNGFPNLYADIFTTYDAENAVIVEGRLVGAQFGSWAGLPASGRVINLPFVAIFAFEQDRLLSKKVYFDSGLMMRQLY
jgi:steroid delta-isomerase-like uncharacterized protein